MSLEKFKEQLKAKSTAAGANLSNKRIDAEAAKLHKRFPEIKDEEVESKLNDYFDEQDLKDLAKEDDRIRTLEANQKKPEQNQQNNNQQENDNQQSSKEMPEWFKPYAEKIQKQDAESAAQNRKASLKQKFEEKKVPEKFWSKMQQPEKEEDFDSFVDGIAKDYAELVPDGNNNFQPGRSNGSNNNGKPTKAQEKEVTNWVDGVMGVHQTNNNN